MNLLSIAFAAALLLLPVTVRADMEAYRGSVSKSWDVIHSSEGDDFQATYRAKKGGWDTISTAHEFPDQRCKKVYLERSGSPRAILVCAKSPGSPMSDTVYLHQKSVGKDCEVEEVYDLFKCIVGCSKAAPRFLKRTGVCC